MGLSNWYMDGWLAGFWAGLENENWMGGGYGKERNKEGAKGKTLFLPPRDRNRGGGGLTVPVPIPALRGTAAAGGRGNAKRKPRGF